MRRGVALLLAVSALGVLAPSALGQYPYPYGPMPYPTPYGYPMPAYVPMPVRPMYYPPTAAPLPTPGRNTKVFVYGPLVDEPAPKPSANLRIPPNPTAPKTDVQPKADMAPVGISQAQAVHMRHGPLPTFSKVELPPEACGPDNDFCAPASGKRPPYEAPMRGHGRFIGEVGAFFLEPQYSARPAFNTTSNGVTTGTEFSRQIEVGPRVVLGYMWHCGWGVRGDYDYLRGATTRQTANGGGGDTISSVPIGPFIINSPSAALNAGIGVDQFTFRQTLERHVADIEFVKECGLLDTIFVIGVGARYARITQTYTATRTNPGGNNGAVSVALDREDISSTNRFSGFGPTVSFEVMHPLRYGFSIYGDVRGAFIFGRDDINRTYVQQNRTVNNGVANFVDTQTNSDLRDVRYAPELEFEAGLQYGCRVGRCYLFARAGFVYQRWWDVGTPTTPDGSISFIGGTARIGITY